MAPKKTKLPPCAEPIDGADAADLDESRKRAYEVAAIRKIVASDPATHHLNASALAERLHMRGLRATRS